MNTMTLELPFDLAVEAGSRPAMRPGGRGVVQRMLVDVLSAEPYAVGSLRAPSAAGTGTVDAPAVGTGSIGTRSLGTRSLGTRPVGTGPVGARSVGVRVAGPGTYRRRRILVAALLCLFLSALPLLGGELIGWVTGTPGATLVEASGQPVIYVVQPGDTLWSIAERVNPPGRDLRYTVDRLSEVTGGSLLHPGQRIVIPHG
jgi:nucleoid-associated protein YgaU